MKHYQYNNELLLARKYIEEGNTIRGKSHMEKVYTFASELMDEDDFVDLALIYDEEKEFHLGMEVYQKMLEIYPDDCQAYYGLGMFSENLGDMKQALDYYKKAIHTDPTYYEAYFFMAGILDELGREDEAISAYEAALDINDNSFWANLNLGAIFESNNQNHKARQLFEKALNIEEHYMAYFNLGVINKKEGMLAESIEMYQNSIERNPFYGYAYLNLSVIYKEMKDYTSGIRILSEGIERIPKTSYLFYHRACHYQLNGEITKSMNDLTVALDLYDGFHEFIKKDGELLAIYEKIT